MPSSSRPGRSGIPSIVVIVLLVVLAGALGPRARAADPPPGDGPEPILRIETVLDGPPPAREPAEASWRPLDPETLREVLGSLPPIAEEPPERAPALPDRPRPPPRAGDTPVREIEGLADGSSPAPAGEARPLRVVGRAPEGEVGAAAGLTVSFSEPMVPLATIAAAESAPVPVTISPPVTGRWRWLGVRTLLFEPTVDVQARSIEVPPGTPTRFPGATAYRVEVPAGTRSAAGAVLTEAVSWSFRTPPPSVAAFEPRRPHAGQDPDPQPCHPLIAIAFDQRIDPSAVLPAVHVDAGGEGVRLRLATAEELATAPWGVRRLVDDLPAGTWLALRPADPLPLDASVTVRVGPGVPSAEGPLVSETARTFGFRTRGPLRVTGQDAFAHRWDPKTLVCSFDLSVTFSTPLDRASIDVPRIRIEPEPPVRSIDTILGGIRILGVPPSRSGYRVVIPAGVRDVEGEELAEEVQVRFDELPAPPWLATPADALPRSGRAPTVVLDPRDAAAYWALSVNHSRLDVRLFPVGPDAWPAYRSYHDAAHWRFERRSFQSPPSYRRSWRPLEGPVPGLGWTPRSVVSIEPPDRADESVHTAIDLASMLEDGVGHVVVQLETEGDPLASADWDRSTTWVQVTRMGLAAVADGRRLIAWASALDDGRPLEGVEVSVKPGDGRVLTGADGLASLPIAGPCGKSPLLVARRGADATILPVDSLIGEDARPERPRDRLVAHLVGDRDVYRPGDTIHAAGWVRRRVEGRVDPELPIPGTALAWQAADEAGRTLAEGRVEPGRLGAFAIEIPLPSLAATGLCSIVLRDPADADRAVAYRHVLVEEYRRPEHEVLLSFDPGPHFLGDPIGATAVARYLSGGALRAAPAEVIVTARDEPWEPPGHPGFRFAASDPWWSHEVDATEDHEATTDATGTVRLRVHVDPASPPLPVRLGAEVGVDDLNFQAWTTRAGTLVHPAALYVGLRARREVLAAGDPIVVETVVADLDGEEAPGVPVRIRAVRLRWEQTGEDWFLREEDPRTAEVASAAAPVPCDLGSVPPGRWGVEASIRDAAGRENASRLVVFVDGEKAPGRSPSLECDFVLVRDRDRYAPGDSAEILGFAPFHPAEALLTVHGREILHVERFRVPEATFRRRIPVDERWFPGASVRVDLVGSSSAGDPAPGKRAERPVASSATLWLDVPPDSRRLSVVVAPRDGELEPGDTTIVDVSVRTSAGDPAADADVLVAVVDDAVLALTRNEVSDPLPSYYPEPRLEPSGAHTRASVAAPPSAAAFSVGGSIEHDLLESVTAGDWSILRRDFRPVALFAPSLSTDADGRLSVPVRLPGTVTRYRVAAVAAWGPCRFGRGTAEIVARRPLVVRPSPPRFLRRGDTFELPVIVQNLAGEAVEANVAVRCGPGLESTGPTGGRLAVAANDRAVLRLPARASAPGPAALQVAARAGSLADAVELRVPVSLPATLETVATYGELDGGAVRFPLLVPRGAIAGVGGLEVSASSTALPGLSDAWLYLARYPHECCEQIASRLLGTLALRGALRALDGGGLPSAAEVDAAIARDAKLLLDLQRYDGGFGLWSREEEAAPYPSIHAAHALVRAREAGLATLDGSLEDCVDHLVTLVSRPPSGYGTAGTRSLRAYALHVLDRIGAVSADLLRRETTPAWIAECARDLAEFAPSGELPAEATGWILTVLARSPRDWRHVGSVLRSIRARAEETAGLARFRDGYGNADPLLFRSDRRADAVILAALCETDAADDLLPKVARGLLADRRRGRWENTQENAFALLALSAYLDRFESESPDFTARAWVGERLVLEEGFRGRSGGTRRLELPYDWLEDRAGGTDGSAIVLAKEGPGRLHYRLALSYAPEALDPEPVSRGFTVARTYLPVDGLDDVRREADGSWRARAGARVRVRVVLIAPGVRHHVALVDPLPAGLEIENPDLETTSTRRGRLERSGQADVDVSREYWVDHHRLRDDQAEAFADTLETGAWTWSYVARATTRGRFSAPPASAEEMYHPETFGRSAPDTVVVE